MQLIITDAWLARSHAIHLSGTKLVLALVGLSLALMLVSLGMYHWVFLKGAREGWPVIGSLVRLVVKDEFAQRDRFMRENIEVMAKKLGEMQAKMLQLESLGERVSGLAGVNPADIKIKPGQGGTLVAGRDLSLDELQSTLNDLDLVANQRTDLYALIGVIGARMELAPMGHRMADGFCAPSLAGRKVSGFESQRVVFVLGDVFFVGRRLMGHSHCLFDFQKVLG